MVDSHTQLNRDSENSAFQARTFAEQIARQCLDEIRVETGTDKIPSTGPLNSEYLKCDTEPLR